MKITILALYATCLCALSSFAQNTHAIKGSVADSASATKLMAAVTVLNAKDSIMYKYTYAGNDGSFSITGLPAGKFLLLVTYPEYADYVEGFNIAEQENEHVFGNINMQLKTSILQEVIIKGTVNTISLKGDTTIVNARALVIQPNAKVEDLLKQVPGMEVDKDGKIKFQGEAVKKVLLDGEEFFGDDPTLVTRNIRGDMVDKFEIFDKKSDQAAFTGIDDGVKNKTVNVVLREDKKNGVFGKLIGGGGAGRKGFYEGQALYNRFTAKAKYSAYATTANDGNTGLGYEDNSKLGTTSSGDVQISDDGSGITYYTSSGSDLYYGGTGLPLSRTGGVHYDSKWNTGKESINTNYKLASLSVTSNQNTLSQKSLPGGEINTDNTSNNYSYRFKQKMDATYQNTFSPTANLKISVNGSTGHSDGTSNSSNLVSDADNVLKSSQISSQNTKSDQKTFNMSALYSKRFKKAGRTISWAANDTYTETNSTNYYLSDVFTPAAPADSMHNIVDQFKPSTIKSTVINSNITYSEPITPSLALTLNYGLGINNSISNVESYNKSASGRYDDLDNVYSNDYKFNQLTNQVGAVFNYRGGTTTIITFGTKASSVNFKQIDEYTGNVYKRNFINWQPQSRVQYKITPSKTLSFNYNGYSTQPTIDQIQPIKVNTDALNLQIGNPNLGPSFSHSFNLGYSMAEMLKNRNFNISGSYSFTTNAIVTNTVTDLTTYVSTINSVNLSGKNPYNYSLRLSDGRQLGFLGLHSSLSLSTSSSVYYNEINGELNQTSTHNYSVSVYLTKEKAKKYSLYGSFGPNYTFSKYSLTPNNNNNAAGLSSYGDATVYLPGKIQLSTDINYSYKAKTQNLPSTSLTTWDGSVSRTFLKGDNLKVSLTGNNLLNQDQNYRSQYNGTITQSTYNTIKRYFMLSVSWDFTKFGITTAKE